MDQVRRSERNPVRRSLQQSLLPPLRFCLRGHSLLRAIKTKQKLVELASSQEYLQTSRRLRTVPGFALGRAHGVGCRGPRNWSTCESSAEIIDHEAQQNKKNISWRVKWKKWLSQCRKCLAIVSVRGYYSQDRPRLMTAKRISWMPNGHFLPHASVMGIDLYQFVVLSTCGGRGQQEQCKVQNKGSQIE